MEGAEVYDFEGWRAWLRLDEERQQEFLTHAWCPRCELTSMAEGWTIKSDTYKVSIVGRCSRCGAPIQRTVQML